jgi:hypothetical protein
VTWTWWVWSYCTKCNKLICFILAACALILADVTFSRTAVRRRAGPQRQRNGFTVKKVLASNRQAEGRHEKHMDARRGSAPAVVGRVRPRCMYRGLALSRACQDALRQHHNMSARSKLGRAAVQSTMIKEAAEQTSSWRAAHGTMCNCPPVPLMKPPPNDGTLQCCRAGCRGPSLPMKPIHPQMGGRTRPESAQLVPSP